MTTASAAILERCFSAVSFADGGRPDGLSTPGKNTPTATPDPASVG
jgi:hypothetical protein